VALALAGGGCSGQGPDDVTPVTGRVLFIITEGFTDPRTVEPPTIQLRLETEAHEPCANYSLETRISRPGGSLVVDVRGVHRPDVCLTAVGPATFQTDLDLANGAYDLRFQVDGATETYGLVVTDTSLEISGPGGARTSPQATLVWRFPERSFAAVCGTTVETAWICPAFRDTLLAIPTVARYTFPPSGRKPYPESSEGCCWHNPPADYFTYATEAAFDAAGARLAAYSRAVVSQHQGVLIHLMSWRNQQFMSWLLAPPGPGAAERRPSHGAVSGRVYAFGATR